MRILCLHGMGTSADIFTSQSAAFRAQLDSKQYIFDFVDAPLASTPAPGIDIFFNGPYYSFYKEPTTAAIKSAIQWLRTLLLQQGPYDCLMGFSQGCALISSFILYHNVEWPDQPLPFKSAIFICGGAPLVVLADLGVDVSKEAWDINDSTGKQLSQKAGAAGAELKAIMEQGATGRRGLWDGTDNLIHDPKAAFPTDRTNVFGLDFTRSPKNVKLTIPTVHVYGCKDPRYPSAIQLAHLSEEGLYRTYDHEGGHDIPRKTTVSQKIAGLVQWLEGMM